MNYCNFDRLFYVLHSICGFTIDKEFFTAVISFKSHPGTDIRGGPGDTSNSPHSEEGHSRVGHSCLLTSGFMIPCRFCVTGFLPDIAVQPGNKKKKGGGRIT